MEALILVDVQNDFLPAGALAVPTGDEVVPVLNRLQEVFSLIVATKDWHPADHGSFAAQYPDREIGQVIELGGLQQVLWPTHCVQWTAGADFAPGLKTDKLARVFTKGDDPGVDSYSGFFDNAADRASARATGLDAFLHRRSVERVYVGGLATDYCVKLTALDAVALGFQTVLVQDACRAVNLRPGDGQRAIAEMARAGIEILDSHQLLTHRTARSVAASA